MPISAEGSGLSCNSFAVCHQITTLDRATLKTVIGSLPAVEMAAVEQGVIAARDLPD